MAGWEPWWAHVKAATDRHGNGVVATGGIFTKTGVPCYVEGSCVVDAKDIVNAITTKSGIKINGVKFMSLGETDDVLNLRGSGTPAVIFKAGTTYILVVGGAGADAGSFASAVIAKMKSEIFFDGENYKI